MCHVKCSYIGTAITIDDITDKEAAALKSLNLFGENDSMYETWYKVADIETNYILVPNYMMVDFNIVDYINGSDAPNLMWHESHNEHFNKQLVKDRFCDVEKLRSLMTCYQLLRGATNTGNAYVAYVTMALEEKNMLRG